KIPFNWRELTPVSVVALDQFILWDNTTLPHANVKDFIAAAKAANPPFKMGGTGSKREDHVLTVFIEKKTGAKFAYLPSKSGGELRRFVPQGDADRRVQGVHGEAGAEADLPHRQGYAQVPGRGRRAQQEPDDRGGLRRQLMAAPEEQPADSPAVASSRSVDIA